MGWTSYYVGNESVKDCVNDLFNRYSRQGYIVKKTVQKGNDFYALMEDKGVDFIALFRTSKSNGEFYYKDIQCNPYESSTVPSSILKMFKPSNDEDKAWLENQLKALAETKKAPTFKIGDLIKCTCDYDIEWGNGFKLEKGKEFVIKVVGSDDLKLFHKANSRNTKNYFVCNLFNGNYQRTPYRIMSKTFKNCKTEILK
jgi:hypothetical protein